MYKEKLQRFKVAENSAQGNKKKVLCVCSAGICRSPTASFIINYEFGYNTRSAGLEPKFALIPVDGVLVHWADQIVCMTQQHVEDIRSIIRYEFGVDGPPHDPLGKEVINLDIEDIYDFCDTELNSQIRRKYKHAEGFIL